MKTVPLADVLDSSKSGFASGKRDAEGVIQLRMNNVTSEGALDLSKLTRIPVTRKQIEAASLQKGDVLFNCTNSPELVGKSCYFPGSDQSFVFSNHFVRLRAKPADLDSQYLARWLAFVRLAGHFEHGCVRWVNQATYRKEDLLSLKIPLPPLPEQKRIAKILDTADALRAKRRESLAQLDSLLQSSFLEMFGDPVENPKGWPEVKIGSLCNKCRSWNPRKEGEGEISYIDLSSIDKQKKEVSQISRFESSETPSRARQLVEAGDVLVATVRPNLNGVAELTEDHDGMTASTGYCVLRPKAEVLETSFLFQWVKTQRFIKSMVDVAIGANYPAVSDTKVRDSLMMNPPIHLQKRFSALAAAITQQKFLVGAQLDELEKLFDSIQSAAFAGKI